MAKSLYSVLPSVAMVETWIAGLKDKTGRSLNEWLTVIGRDGPADEKSCRDWLKRTHRLGSNSAWWLAEMAHGGPDRVAQDTPNGYLRLAPEYVNQQYAGKKAILRPLYDRLLREALDLGKDVKACPCKTIVPLYRQNVFAQLKPTTNTRIDLGLALGKVSDAAIRRAGKRLIDTGGKAKKDRLTHRIVIERIEDIDEFARRWLRQAYDLDAPTPGRRPPAKPMMRT